MTVPLYSVLMRPQLELPGPVLDCKCKRDLDMLGRVQQWLVKIIKGVKLLSYKGILKEVESLVEKTV